MRCHYRNRNTKDITYSNDAKVTQRKQPKQSTQQQKAPVEDIQ